MLTLLKRLFGPRRKEEGGTSGYDVHNIIPIKTPSSSTTAGIVREIVANAMHIPRYTVYDSMVIGREGRDIGMLVAFQLGVMVSMSAGSTTVGDLIQQCEQQLESKTK